MKIKWDNTDELSRAKAQTTVENLIKVGWWYELKYEYELNNRNHLPPKPSFYKKHNTIELTDLLKLVLGSQDLCSIMDYLVVLGLQPLLSSIYVDGKPMFVFIIDLSGGNIYTTHRHATQAAMNAVKAWIKAGRPFTPYTDPQRSVIWFGSPMANIEKILEQNDGLCMDVKAERKKLAKALIKGLG
jgi:hypothetical protein